MPLGIGAGTAILGGAALSGITSLIGGGKQASAARQAAQLQVQAANRAADLQQQRFETTTGLLSPFIGFGEQAMPDIQALTGVGGGAAGVLNAPLTQQPGQVAGQPLPQWAPTMDQLANMPGYQFQLQQGLLAAQAPEIAMGRGKSGALIKASEKFASGLAAQDWMNNWLQFQGMQNLNLANRDQALRQQGLNLQGRAQTYNMLTGQLGTGLSAAGSLSGASIQSGANIGNTIQAGGAAAASGVVGASNALFGPGGGVTGAGQGAGNALLLSGLIANQQANSNLTNFQGTGFSAGDVASLSPDSAQALAAFNAAGGTPSF